MFYAVQDKDGKYIGYCTRNQDKKIYTDLQYCDIALIGRLEKIQKLERSMSQICHHLGVHIGQTNDSCQKEKSTNNYNGPVAIYMTSLRDSSIFNVSCVH